MTQDLPPPVDRGAELTERLIADAGIGPGMHVLDVGCGPGKVTVMLPQRVGLTGQVTGLDINEEVLSMARTRVQELGLPQVDFVAGHLASPPGESYDAIFGRRVLMYQPDRVATMKALAARLRPGGLAVFQELDATMVPAPTGTHPLHHKVHRWVWDTVQREGATPSMGFELPHAFEAAGLELKGLRAEAIVQTAQQQHMTATIVEAVLPRIIAAGVATADEVDVPTLQARLTEELRQSNTPYVGDMVFSGWARKPL